MTIEAKIIADSIDFCNSASIARNTNRITTMQLRYPRFIHAEFMTHRDFSRNASSSRAIPVKRLIEDILRDPAMPVWWGKNQAGMQAREELSPNERDEARALWLTALMDAVKTANKLDALGAHKQIVNRVLEPFSHINVVVTSTKWTNFYGLRRHPDAQPEIKVLADAMWDAQRASTPRRLDFNDVRGWHLPYVSDEERAIHDSTVLQKVSAARCARVSYLTFEGRTPNLDEDLNLFAKLAGGVPLHASPCEHQAIPRNWDSDDDLGGNFGPGWIQFRKMLANEYIDV